MKEQDGGYTRSFPREKIDVVKLSNGLAENQQILIMVHIEYMSKVTPEMTKEELKQLYIDISDRYNVPNDLIKEM